MSWPDSLRLIPGGYKARRHVILFATILSSAAAMQQACQRRVADGPKTFHIVLVGASIGQAWRLEQWPVRAGMQQFTAEAVAAWQFDKSTALEEVLMRPRVKFRLMRSYLRSLLRPPRRADLIILKECSAYFPGDARAYRESIRKWVEQIRERNIMVMVATVVPVTRARAARDPGKQEAVREFNQWLREYAGRENVPLLDLEAVLSTPDEGRYLRDELALPDGSHLNALAYQRLDSLLRDRLRAALAELANNRARR